MRLGTCPAWCTLATTSPHPRSPPSAPALQAIVVAAVLANAANFGVNLQPILAFGSISTVAVGFAAQSTMANVVSALQICAPGGCVASGVWLLGRHGACAAS